MGLEWRQPSQHFGPIIAGCRVILHLKNVGEVGGRGGVMILGAVVLVLYKKIAIIRVRCSSIDIGTVSLGIRVVGELGNGESMISRDVAIACVWG